MKKKFFYSALLAGGVLLSSCNTYWEDEKVPESIKVRFSEMYPGIKKVDWDIEGSTFEADFKIDGREREVLLDASGAFVQVTEEIAKMDLPNTILDLIAEKYNAYSIDEAHRVQQQAAQNYFVELEHRKQEITLTFNEAGQLIKETGAAANRQSQKVEEQASVLPIPISDETIKLLGKPAARWELPEELLEVSGIAILPDGKVACVQDEEGSIFIYNTKAGKVEKKIPFSGPGDYEGIVLVGDEAVILRSDATLFRVKNYTTGKPDVSTYKLGLAPTQDTEGMAYDAAHNRLLIAGKGYDRKYGNKKAIFAFDLENNKVQAEPVIFISLPHKNLVSKKKKAKSVYDALQTASLEFHPQTNELYLLDAENSRIMVLNEQGELSKITNLNDKILPKAEGLTFGPNGEMYISSEGTKKKSAVITKYNQGL